MKMLYIFGSVIGLTALMVSGSALMGTPVIENHYMLTRAAYGFAFAILFVTGKPK